MFVTHLIIGLGKGGAETMLYQLLKYKNDKKINYKVISLGASHYYEEYIRKLGVEVVELNIRKSPILSVVKLLHEVKGSDVLCCWMYHANLIGFFAGKLSGVKKIIWNIRHSNLSTELNNKMTLRINKVCAKLSRYVDIVAYNGNEASRVHLQAGYSTSNCMVLANGVDCDVYKPDAVAHDLIREYLGINNDCFTFTSVARYVPIKDIPTFIRAFSIVKSRYTKCVGIMCGIDITEDNKEIVDLCSECGLVINEDIYLLGQRDDIEKILAGTDFFVLHSAGEAFPNVLVQAMACGCKCIATNVGDVNNIFPYANAIASPQKPSEIAEICLNLLANPELQDGITNRIHVIENYSIKRIVQMYESMIVSS